MHAQSCHLVATHSCRTKGAGQVGDVLRKRAAGPSGHKGGRWGPRQGELGTRLLWAPSVLRKGGGK